MKKVFSFLLFILISISTLKGQELYVSDDKGGIYSLTINGCSLQKICQLPYPLHDIAMSSNGTMYGISGNKLLFIDLANCTISKEVILPGNGNNLVYSNGLLYTLLYDASTNAGKNLYSYNIASGQATLIGNTGFLSEGDLTFYEGKMYLTSVGNKIVEIDIANPSSSVLIHSIPYANALFGILSTKIDPTKCVGMDMIAVASTGDILRYNINNNTISPLCSTGMTIYGGTSPFEDKVTTGKKVDLFPCYDEKPLVLNANSGDSYLWNTGATTQSLTVNSAGTYSVNISKDTCHFKDTFNVVFVEKHAQVSGPTSACEGDNVTMNSSDASCATMKWYTSETSSTPAHIGCSYSFTFNTDGQCVYYEPFQPDERTAGAKSNQTWGVDPSNTGTFDVLKPFVLDGFTVNGDQYWSGCTPYNATFTVERANVVVAGPITRTVNCSASAASVISGLNFILPVGTGYKLKVSGATLQPTTGQVVSIPGVIKVTKSGPFYNWKILLDSNQIKCTVKDKICITSSCGCPDTTLKFSSPICSDKTFDLNTLKTATTSPGVWKIVQKPAGSSSATLTGTTFNAGKNGDGGDYVVAYVLTGGPFPNCPDSNVRTIHINKLEVAKIPRPQGVFCISDPEQTLQLDPTSDAGTWSGTGITDAVAGKFNPATAGIGNHLITYKTNGVCFAQDTITITVVNQKISNITSPDTTVCKNAASFKLRLSANSTANGVWLSVPSGLVSSNGTITPSLGQTAVPYKVYYALQGATLLCSAIDSVTITIKAIDTAKITPKQGPFCIDAPALNLQKETVSASGKWSGTGISDGALGTFNPSVARVGVKVITYTTDGMCPVIDTVHIEVKPKMVSNILTPDTTLCKTASAFKIRLSANSTANGTWLSLPAGLVSNNGTITPSKGQANVPYKVYYIAQGFDMLCSAADSVTITLIAPDTAKITPKQGPFCVERAALDLRKENVSSVGKWSGTGVTDVNAGTFNPKTAGVGVKVITYTTSGVCPYVDTVHIEVKAKTIANIVNGDTTLCENTPTYNLKLSSNSTVGGKWYKDNVLASTLVQTTPAGNYYMKYVTLGISSECDNRDSVKITILPNEDASIVTPLKKDVCPSDAEIVLQSKVQPSKGVWWGIPITGVDVTGKYNPSTANVGSTKVYYGVAGKCGDTSSVEFIKHVVPTFDLGPDKILCEGEQVQIGTVVTADTILWQPTGEKTQSINVSTTGDYVLKLSNFPGCKYVDTIHVEVLPYPVINIGNDTILCFEDLNNEFVLDAKNAACEFLWNTGETTQQITIHQEGAYSVIANYPNSTCSTSDVVRITEYCPYSIFFPNAITLNGDGINDRFPTPHHNLKGYHLMIFNRWGELLFETYDYTNLWDGTYQGQKVQEDVYVWKCDYKVEELDKKIVKKTEIGRVTVIR